MPLILEPWEKVRASELERRVREFALEGTTGAETTPAPLAGVMTPEQYDAQGIGPGARSAAYTTFPPLAIQPPWWWASPVPTGTLDLGVAPMQIPGGFANGWGDYAGAFPAAARVGRSGAGSTKMVDVSVGFACAMMPRSSSSPRMFARAAAGKAPA